MTATQPQLQRTGDRGIDHVLCEFALALLDVEPIDDGHRACFEKADDFNRIVPEFLRRRAS
jgi:hypothetical protein